MSAANLAGMAAAGSQIKNEYAGFTLPSAEYKLDEVAVDRLGSKWFWENYISIRKPCIIVGVIPGFHGDRWSNE